MEIQYGNDQLRCSSDANPEVLLEGYTFIINGTEEYPPTECSESDGECSLNLKVEYDTHVMCNASNAVGMGTTDILAVPGMFMCVMMAY